MAWTIVVETNIILSKTYGRIHMSGLCVSVCVCVVLIRANREQVCIATFCPTW
jgi:hypothetical protein